jgi:transcriptional regulator GlxA family with amidase domain
MLVESNLSIKEIASALGYRDIYFFSRQFKAKMGITPSEARRRGVMR